MTRNMAKRAFFLSILALMLCFMMLIGTTFAWFTDSVSSDNNTIQAGNLDVELAYARAPIAVSAITVPTALWKQNNPYTFSGAESLRIQRNQGYFKFLNEKLCILRAKLPLFTVASLFFVYA